MKDTLNKTIRIAGHDPMPLQIQRNDEEIVRTAEYNVNRLFNNWTQRFKEKSKSEILAMVAYRFAELLYTQNARLEQTNRLLESFEADLDKILLDVGGEPPRQ